MAPLHGVPVLIAYQNAPHRKGALPIDCQRNSLWLSRSALVHVKANGVRHRDYRIAPPNASGAGALTSCSVSPLTQGCPNPQIPSAAQSVSGTPPRFLLCFRQLATPHDSGELSAFRRFLIRCGSGFLSRFNAFASPSCEQALAPDTHDDETH